MRQRIAVLVIIWTACLQLSFSQKLIDRIKSMPDIISVQKMENNPFFREALIIMVKQPLDHRHPEYGSFPQRVVLSHLDFEEPVVFITEGYNANSELTSKYLNELCPILNANQLFAEHRYFGKSAPDSMKWEYLTVENAAADHHHLVELFKKIYSGKWINTGISKGGQATLFYRFLYPDDVSETVAYVAPLNFSVEEKRHDKFIRHKAGTAQERKKVMAFQKELLRRKESLLPMFEEHCKSAGYQFRIPVSEIYDYCVLEYSFSFWQWGHPADEIPDTGSENEKVLNHLIKIVSPDYFDSISGRVVMPFFVQALRELGYYAYNPNPFRKIISVKNTAGYVKKIFVPREAVFPYEPELSRGLQRYLKKKANNILLIYGENDPWSASGVNAGRNNKVKKFVVEDGSHLSRINSLPKAEREKAIRLLKQWLN